MDEARALLGVFLLLLALAPAGTRQHRRPPVWINPCRAADGWRGRGREADPEDLEVGGKHRPSAKPLRRLRLQTTITKSHFLALYPNLQNLLCNKVTLFGSEMNYSWLPQNPTHWYKKKIKCLDKKGKVLSVLPTFHEGLQRYSASLERLRESPWNMQLGLDCRNRRKRLLDEIAGKLNQLLCELDKCMRDLGIWRGPGLREKEGRSLVPPARDVTSAHLLEATVLSAYGNYIKDWNRIVRQVVGPKGSRTCSPK